MKDVEDIEYGVSESMREQLRKIRDKFREEADEINNMIDMYPSLSLRKYAKLCKIYNKLCE